MPTGPPSILDQLTVGEGIPDALQNKVLMSLSVNVWLTSKGSIAGGTVIEVVRKSEVSVK